MKREVSAGGVVVRSHNARWYVLLMRDMNDNWTFPKGIIEAGESPQQAAAREVLEEVGISNLTCLSPLRSIRYMYKKGSRIEKTVHYFLFQTTTQENPSHQKEEGIKDAQWFTIRKALSIVGYRETNRELLMQAQRVLGDSV